MRLLIETLQVVRAESGGRMAVGMRLNCDELLPGGYETGDASRILKIIADAGLIDFVDLDVAVEPNQLHLGMPSVFVKPHVYRPYVEAVRSAAGKVPVLSVLGRLTSIADAEAAIAAGVCDMTGAARALIAEPNLVKNAREGREERSRTCIACNWCLAAMYDGAMSCAINPVSFRERVWGDESVRAPQRSKVIVIGAGPGGLEAARTSALRGHDVTMIEAREQLGGAFALWASLPGREFYRKAIEWWEQEVRRLGVSVRLGERATPESILREQPDAVIVATGALYSRGGHGSHRDLPIPGHERGFVYRPEELLTLPKLPSGKVVIFDNEGMHAGVGIAELLAAHGAAVELMTAGFSPLSPRVWGAQEGRPIIERLRKAGVQLSPTSWIREIRERELLVQDVYSESVRTIAEVDAVVLTTGRVAVNELEKTLEGKVPQLFTIGDALAPRVWAAASFEGHKFARYIGEPDAPQSVFDVYFADDDPLLVPIPGDMRRSSPGHLPPSGR